MDTNELFKLFNLGFTTLKRNTAVQFYKNFNIDFTYPIALNAKLTNSCNSKCNMCDVWRKNEKEIPASYWIKALKDLKTIIGNYKIGFSGGEVLLKNDVFEIFEFCNQAKLPFGIITNGALLNSDKIIRLLELRPMNISISLDSLNVDTYQKIRGVPFLESVISNIDYLMMYIEKNSLRTKVFFKTVVNSHNLTELHLLANYATEKKVAGITFDPIRRRRKIFLGGKIVEFEKMSNIDMRTLREEKKRLIELKRNGSSILNSEKNINQWFEDCYKNDEYFCDAPLTRIHIINEGQIKLCDFTESSVGNIMTDDIREIFKSEKLKIEKKTLTHCKNPCVYCIHRSLFDYLKIFNSYIKN